MISYAALLRAVNLGRHGKIGMSALRDVASSLGLGAPRTLLQSGNLVFTTSLAGDCALEEMLEEACATQASLATDIYVRSGAELRSIVAENPFPDEAERDPAHLVVLFYKAPLVASSVEALRAAIQGRERVEARGRELYAVYPDGIGTSKLTQDVLARKLGARGTGRNWNTVLKLVELTQDAPTSHAASPSNERPAKRVTATVAIATKKPSKARSNEAASKLAGEAGADGARAAKSAPKERRPKGR